MKKLLKKNEAVPEYQEFRSKLKEFAAKGHLHSLKEYYKSIRFRRGWQDETMEQLNKIRKRHFEIAKTEESRGNGYFALSHYKKAAEYGHIKSLEWIIHRYSGVIHPKTLNKTKKHLIECYKQKIKTLSECSISSAERHIARAVLHIKGAEQKIMKIMQEANVDQSHHEETLSTLKETLKYANQEKANKNEVVLAMNEYLFSTLNNKNPRIKEANNALYDATEEHFKAQEEHLKAKEAKIKRNDYHHRAAELGSLQSIGHLLDSSSITAQEKSELQNQLLVFGEKYLIKSKEMEHLYKKTERKIDSVLNGYPTISPEKRKYLKNECLDIKEKARMYSKAHLEVIDDLLSKYSEITDEEKETLKAQIFSLDPIAWGKAKKKSEKYDKFAMDYLQSAKIYGKKKEAEAIIATHNPDKLTQEAKEALRNLKGARQGIESAKQALVEHNKKTSEMRAQSEVMNKTFYKISPLQHSTYWDLPKADREAFYKNRLENINLHMRLSRAYTELSYLTKDAAQKASHQSSARESEDKARETCKQVISQINSGIKIQILRQNRTDAGCVVERAFKSDQNRVNALTALVKSYDEIIDFYGKIRGICQPIGEEYSNTEARLWDNVGCANKWRAELKSLTERLSQEQNS